MELKSLALKTFFEKVWLYIKLYWKELAFTIAIVYLLFFVKKKNNMIQELIEQRQRERIAHQQNVDRLSQQIQAEVALRRKIDSDFQALIERINKQHSDEVKRIASVRAEEIKKLIAKHQNNPVLIAQSINGLFGIEVMPVPTEVQPWEPNQ